MTRECARRIAENAQSSGNRPRRRCASHPAAINAYAANGNHFFRMACGNSQREFGMKYGLNSSRAHRPRPAKEIEGAKAIITKRGEAMRSDSPRYRASDGASGKSAGTARRRPRRLRECRHRHLVVLAVVIISDIAIINLKRKQKPAPRHQRGLKRLSHHRQK